MGFPILPYGVHECSQTSPEMSYMLFDTFDGTFRPILGDLGQFEISTMFFIFRQDFGAFPCLYSAKRPNFEKS